MLRLQRHRQNRAYRGPRGAATTTIPRSPHHGSFPFTPRAKPVRDAEMENMMAARLKEPLRSR